MSSPVNAVSPKHMVLPDVATQAQQNDGRCFRTKCELSEATVMGIHINSYSSDSAVAAAVNAGTARGK